MRELNSKDEMPRLEAVEVKLRARYPSRILAVRKLPAPPRWPGLAGHVSPELNEFVQELMALLFQGKGMIAPDVEDSGPNLASALAHLWDSAPEELVLGRPTVLDLPNDTNASIHGGLLGAAGLRLTCLATEEDVEGDRMTVVAFEADQALPPVTKQLAAQVRRRLPKLMGPFGSLF